MARIRVSPSTVKAGETVSITPYNMSIGEEYIISVSIGSYYKEFSGTYTSDPLVNLTVSYTVPSDASGTLECNIYLYNKSGDPLVGGQGWYVADSAYATVEQSGFTIDYMGDISSYGSAYIDSYQILMYSYTPTAAGTLKWYSSGSIDVYGWISRESYCDLDSNGYPTSCITSNDDGAGNGNFSMSITASANTTYYLYARCYSSSNSGSVTLYADFQPNYSLSSGGTLTSSTYTHIGSYNIIRFTYTPTISGTLIWNASTGVNTVGWISNSTSWNVDSYGQPYSGYYIGSYNGDYNGTAFRATATVTAGTTYYLYVCGYSGSAGYVTLTAAVRPNDWSWTSTVAQNSQIKLTAAEWNNFTARINQFRSYKGLSAYSFTTAVKNSTPIEAGICNQARTAIDAISGHGTLPTALVSGGTLYASFFNGLKNALNAIS